MTDKQITEAIESLIKLNEKCFSISQTMMIKKEIKMLQELRNKK